MTTITAPLTSLAFAALVPDVVRSCVVLQPSPPPDPGETPPAPITGPDIYTPIAPGVTYANLPVAPTIVDTSPDQMIGCIVTVADNPQGRLNALFPSAVDGDGVIDRATNDIWVYDGATWNNVGPTPGPTITATVVIPPWNETLLAVARTRTKLSVNALAYALQLLTEPAPLTTSTTLTARSVPAYIAVPATSFTLAQQTPTVSIVDTTQSSIVNSLTYTGTGSALTVQTPYVDPSLIFIRDLNNTGDIYVFDRVRGATKYWRPSDAAQPESTDAQALTAFGNASFTVGTSSLINTSTNTYLVWAFGGTAPAVTNTSGTIQTTVSVSDVFSIATYTGNGVAGATIGHGMTGTPDAVLVKRMSSGVNARGLMGGPTLGTNVNVDFGAAEAKTTNSALIRSAGASTVELGNSSSVNSNGAVYAAYSFRSVAGKSKIGTYTGDGSGSGQFIQCDFPVDFVIVKAIDTASGYWFIFNRTFEATGDTWTALETAAPYQESNVMYGIEGTGFRVFIGDDVDLYDDLYMAFAAVRPSAYVDTTTDIALAAPVPSVTAN
jgi:hypothetical protein